MDENFSDDEKLYRAVYPASQYSYFWKKNGKISSAAFKKRDGLSVERGNFRLDNEVIEDMRKFFSVNIVSVTVKQCRDISAVVKYLPTERSKYHSEIHSSDERMLLTESQAKYLADSAIIEYSEQFN